MGKGIYIALLNPAISAIFAGGFFLLWRHQRERPYIRMLAVSYLAGVFGFLVQCIPLPIGEGPTRLLSNACFLITGYMLATGVAGRFERRPPHLALSLVCLVGIAVLAWFLFVTPNMAWRILVINASVAAIAFIIAAELRTVPRKMFVDQVLMVAFVVDGV
ncbi:GGDEF domain-containing protein, partial [Rhizobiaceae sp. 2RAB30]